MLAACVQDCANGALPITECGSAWQLGLIVLLLFCAVFALVGLRLSAGASP